MTSSTSAHTAAVLAFVRTDAGVVQVNPGEVVPNGADPEHVEALVAAGVLEVQASKKPLSVKLDDEKDSDPS